MKILYNLPTITEIGGKHRIVLDKASWLADNGYDVVVVTADQCDESSFFAVSPRIKFIGLGIDYLWKDNNLFKKVIHRPIMKIRHRRKLKNVLMQERPDITIMTGDDIGLDINDGSKKIFEFHTSKEYLLKPRSNNPLWRILNIYARWQKELNVKKYDAFVCLTNEDKEDWGEIKNLRVIPNYISHKNPLSFLDKKQAIAVGRLVQVKRFDRLIIAWEIVHRSCPDWSLRIYGTGPLKEDLKKLIIEKGLCNVVQICEPTKEIMKAYAESSVIISTSDNEGLPMVMLEAMSCGLPIVSFDYKCGPKDLITDGKNGFLVKDNDIETLSEKIIQVLKDEQLRKSMGKKSFEESQQYDELIIMHKWEILFHELCKNRKN